LDLCWSWTLVWSKLPPHTKSWANCPIHTTTTRVACMGCMAAVNTRFLHVCSCCFFLLGPWHGHFDARTHAEYALGLGDHLRIKQLRKANLGEIRSQRR
jgi:hypothetical protein